MATSTGAVGGSVIDVQSLVSQLVAAERAPLDHQIARETSRVTSRISALGAFKGALSTFQSALGTLRTQSAFNVRSATSSDETVFTASATGSSVPGTYSIEVVDLAKAQQLRSNVFAGGSTEVVGTGTLTVQLGTESFSLTIDGTNSTLAGIRDAINAAADNPGVAATIVNGASGAHLVLSSGQTGAANTLQVSQTGDSGLEQLVYGPGDTTRYTEISAAQDASVMVAGVQVTSDTNSVANAIDGVTLELAAEQPGTTLSLTIANDLATATSRIKTFVTEYNKLQSTFTQLRSYDATTRAAGPMLGDALLNGMESQLRRILSNPVEGATGNYQTLSSIGITTQADGTLSVEDTKLQAALEADFEGVSYLFGAESGVAARAYEHIDDALETGSAIDTRTQTLVKQQSALTKRQSDVDARMQTVYASYIRQFTALDTLLSQLQTTSSFLTQQLDNLPKMSGQR